jgi:hypothetical protein
MSATEARVLELLGDWRWRLNNLYFITDKQGRRVQFKMNWAQESLFDGMHYLNVILKARQLGFTTFIQLFMLDVCLFNSNVRAGTIAHTLDDAKIIFRDKVKYPYDSLPDQLKAAIPAQKDTANELVLGNNSSIRVGTSLRSGTLQYLHISEYGKICAKYPEKAREIRTGALNTVESGQIAFIESTAEGQEGDFFDICEDAQAKHRQGSKLTPLDFKFHFYPWWKNPEYALDPADVVIPDLQRQYFDKLVTSEGIRLTPAQQAWYVKKAERQLGDMKREYPSTPKEAFEASIEGAYYAENIAQAELEGRIGLHPPIKGVPVYTVWDIGVGDDTTIWFWQAVGKKIGVVASYHNSGEGVPFYVDRLAEYEQRMGWAYAQHFYPHDADVKEWGSGRTRVEQITDALKAKRISGSDYIPRVLPQHHIDDGINAARAIFPLCWFNEAECADGLKALKAYRKEWDEEHGCWKDKPRHDWASHYADGYRYLAMAYREIIPVKPKEEPQEPRVFAGSDGRMHSTISIKRWTEKAERERLNDE